MSTTAPKPTPPKPWLSGYCNPANPKDSHDRCLGAYDGRPCKCPHHLVEKLLPHAHGIRVSADAVLTFPLDGIGWDDAVRIGNELRMARAAISAAEEFVAKHVGDTWPASWKDEQTVEGVGRAQPYRTRNTTWDTDDVVKEVVEQRMAAAGGEVADPMAVVRWLLDVAHIDYFRVGKLNELDIDADEYRHTTFGTVRLRIKSDDMVGETTRDAS